MANIPRSPRAERPNRYRISTLELTDFQAGTSVFEILTSRYSAYGFIIDVLYNMDFPLAARASTLRDYQEDPEYYAECMNAWEDMPKDPDTVTYFISRGKLYTLSEETTLEEAIAAIRAAEYVDCLVQSNSSTDVVFNGYIYYDEFGDMWRADLEMGEDAPQDESDYRLVHHTHVQTLVHTYQADYESGDMEIFTAETDDDALEYARSYQSELGMLFNLFEVDGDSYDIIRTIL